MEWYNYEQGNVEYLVHRKDQYIDLHISFDNKTCEFEGTLIRVIFGVLMRLQLTYEQCQLFWFKYRYNSVTKTF